MDTAYDRKYKLTYVMKRTGFDTTSRSRSVNIKQRWNIFKTIARSDAVIYLIKEKIIIYFTSVRT